jgi:hypothetical protein
VLDPLVDGVTTGDRVDEADTRGDAEMEGEEVPTGEDVLERESAADGVPLRVACPGEAVARVLADALGETVFVTLEQAVDEPEREAAFEEEPAPPPLVEAVRDAPSDTDAAADALPVVATERDGVSDGDADCEGDSVVAPESVAGSAVRDRNAVADGLSADDTVGAACVGLAEVEDDGVAEWLAEGEALELPRPPDTDAAALPVFPPVSLGSSLALGFALVDGSGDELAVTQTVALCEEAGVCELVAEAVTVGDESTVTDALADAAADSEGD